MARARRDLGPVRSVTPESLGKPGQRTFRVVVRGERGEATVWLEKEHMAALVMSIETVLAEAPGEGSVAEGPGPGVRAEASAPQGERPVEFKAAALAIVYDSPRRTFGVLAYDADDASSSTATLAWWLTREQAKRLAEDAAEIVSSGRPICPLCHRPKDPSGHMCTETNGHQAAKDHF
ncbi:MAG: DUF3090 family protein [Dehalococcoidia bacterium]|nr:DUF3090 family protein [Dehalococcoidia bacterium]